MSESSKGKYFLVRRGATALTNKVILSGLSLQAIGVLMVALSQRPGTPLGYRTFVGRGMGEKAVQKTLRELEGAGLRHRILTRTKSGLLRELVVMADEPLTQEEVLSEIELAPGDFFLHFKSMIEDKESFEAVSEATPVSTQIRSHNRSSDRAVPGTARSKQASEKDIEQPNRAASGTAPSDQQEHSKPAGRTVQRPTAARSTAARSSTAGRSPNTLRVNNSTSPLTPTGKSAEDLQADAGVATPLGGSPDGDRGGENSSFHEKDSGMRTASGSASQADLRLATPADVIDVITRTEEAPAGLEGEHFANSDLLSRVLPKSMCAIPPKSAHRVASMIRERLDAGWTIETLHAALEARALPSKVRNLSALVIARFRDDIPVDGAPPKQAVVLPPRELVRADGSPVKHYDLDWGLIAMDHKQALGAGTTSATTRRQFVLDAGVERYLLGA